MIRKTKTAVAAVTVGMTGFCGQPARAQSLDLPVAYELNLGDNLHLAANIAIGNSSVSLPYLFDTGSNEFNAEYVNSNNQPVFGSIQSPQSNLPQGVTYHYTNQDSLMGNLVEASSFTFYPSSTSQLTPVTLTARTASGAPAKFVINALDTLNGNPLTQPTPIFGGTLYGAFGIGYDANAVTGTNGVKGQYSSPLGQTVIPGTSGGWIVAANGASLNTIGEIVGHQFPAAAAANGQQGSVGNLGSVPAGKVCSPCGIVGLTPALVAQFQLRNTINWIASGVPFRNTDYPSSAHDYVLSNYAVASPSLTLQGQSQTVFDTGTPIDRLGLQPVSGTILNPPNAIFTSSGTAAGANTLTNTVVPNSPYSLQVNQQGIFGPTEPGNIIGIGFFLQNSVLFNLTGRAIAYTPNFVTDIDIPTTPSTPLSVGSSSVPLGLAGVISGSGGVMITSGGSATLSGANTYTGATNVAGGYLALVGPGTIASSSGVDVNQEGLFDISGVGGSFLGVTTPQIAAIQSLSGDSKGMVYLGNSDLVLTNASGAFAGAIVGSGGLALLQGTETLTGSSSYAGSTTVDGGMLVVDGALTGTSSVTVAGGVLSGSGTLVSPMTTVASGGVLAPGISGGSLASMTILGNLALEPGSAYAVGITPSASNAAHVSGSASLGGSVEALFAPGLYHPQQYSILTASSLSGTFGGIEAADLPPNFSANLIYGPGYVTLSLAAALGGPGAPFFSGNQRSVASSLNGAFNAGAAMPGNYQLLYSQTGRSLSNAVNTISGEATTGAATASISLANQFLGLMLDPFTFGNGSAQGPRSSSSALGLPRGWNVWASGFGGSASASGDAGVGSHNSLANSAGFAAGADYAVAPGVAIGAALSGSNLGWGLSDGLGGGSGNAFQAGLYGATRRGSVYFAAAGAFAEEWLSTRRAGPFQGPITANMTVQDFAGRAELGDAVGLALGAQSMTLSPYVALQAQAVENPNYAETDQTFSGFGLSYSSLSQGYASSEIGARFDAPLPLQGPMTADLRLRAAYAHDWTGASTMNAAFEALPGSAFKVTGATLPKNAALLTAEADLTVGSNLSALLKLDGALAPTANAIGGSATLRYAF